MPQSPSQNLAPSIYSLNGAWRVGRVPQHPLSFNGDDRAYVAEWLPAQVPGNIHADLMRAGHLPNLYYGNNIKEAAWVDASDWWLEHTFTLSLRPDERAFLHFDGMDYIATLWLDDHCLGSHEGAFSRHTIEITPFVQQDEEEHSYRLAVRLWGARAWPQPEWQWWERLLIPLTRLVHPGKASIRPYHPRLRLLRPPMQAGWDFAPSLPAIGLWEGVRLETTGPVRVVSARVGEWFFAPQGETAHTNVTIRLDALQATCVTLRLLCAPYNFAGERSDVITEHSLSAGQNSVVVSLNLTNPQRWHPWEQGDPNLYTVTANVESGGNLISTSSLRIGIRTVDLDEMRLTVNGAPFFARGVNWVPADILLGTVPPARYRYLLDLARTSGVNLLRVWGGGGRERREFYDLCDELGLLIWQEFPFACAFLDHYPRESEFLALSAQETGAMVGELRHHPSLAFWCAGNEFSHRRNRPLINALKDVVRQEDERPFLPPSPGQLDRHNWHVWHGLAPVQEYADEESRFLSEFGLQAPPALSSLQRFLPTDALWPPNAVWERHHADVRKLARYSPVTAQEDLQRFVGASQAAQAWGVQVAVERMRRRKSDGAGGVAIWQWNEPWPAISWALVDYYGVPKLAIEGLKQWYDPLLLSLEWELAQALKEGGIFKATLWAINDLVEGLDGCEARLWQGDALLWSHSLSLPPFSSRVVADIAVRLPHGMNQLLRLDLSRHNKLLASNSYPLYPPDPRRAPAVRQLYRSLSEVVMRW